MNEVSKQGFKEILSIAVIASETELEEVFAAMSFPCTGMVKNKTRFVKNLMSRILVPKI